MAIREKRVDNSLLDLAQFGSTRVQRHYYLSKNSTDLISFVDAGNTLVIDGSCEILGRSTFEFITQTKRPDLITLYCNPSTELDRIEELEQLRGMGTTVHEDCHFIKRFYENYTWDQQTALEHRTYNLLTGKTKPWRTVLVGLLAYHDLLQYGHVSFFGGHFVDQQFDTSKITDIDQLNISSNIHQQVMDGLSKITLPLTVDYKTFNRNISHARHFNSSPYIHSDFSVICETDCRDNIFFPTEKVMKTISLNKKFIVLGSYKFLQMLKLYFKYEMNTDISHLTDWCDNSYDSQKNTLDRILMVVDIISEQVNK